MAISKLASRATASTLFFTNLLLRLNRSPPVVAATRSFISISVYTGGPPNYTDEEAYQRSWREHIEQLERTKHPFIREGPRSPLFGVGYGNKSIVRIDMPGVGKEGLSIRPENLSIGPEKNGYVIEGVSDSTDDEEKRVYTNHLCLDPAYVMKDGITATVENGVARIVFRLHHDHWFNGSVFL